MGFIVGDLASTQECGVYCAGSFSNSFICPGRGCGWYPINFTEWALASLMPNEILKDTRVH